MTTIAKALAAFVTTALAQLGVVLTGPAASIGELTDGQWVTLVSASLASALAVYTIPNRRTTP